MQKGHIFHLILVGILTILILSIKNRGEGGRGLLNGQNLLNVTKVANSNFCRQSSPSFKMFEQSTHIILQAPSCLLNVFLYFEK